MNNTSRVQTREPRLVLIFVHQYIRNMTLTHRAASSESKFITIKRPSTEVAKVQDFMEHLSLTLVLGLG